MAANQDNVEALLNLGNMYAKGKGTVQDNLKAVKYYELAANQGDSLAQYNAGSMYYQGKGGNQNYIKAKQYFRLACEGGENEACDQYSILNKQGH